MAIGTLVSHVAAGSSWGAIIALLGLGGFFPCFLPVFTLIVGYIYLIKWSDETPGPWWYIKLSSGTISLCAISTLMVGCLWFLSHYVGLI